MRSGCWSLLVLVLLVGWGHPVPAQDGSRAVIERAIQAHGGMQRLSQLRADRVKIKGSLFLNDKAVSFTGETWVQLPAQLKTVVQISQDNRTHTLIQVLNGEMAWVTLNGQPQKVEPAALAEMRQTLALARAVRLVPLLTDKIYDLSSLGESKVNDRVLVGVKVAIKGNKDLRLYFDKETGLLVKTAHALDDSNGKEVEQEEHYSDFQDLGGFKRPVKLVGLRKGGKIMEAELVDVKYLDAINGAEFAKP
jgi:hypothetical protein